MSVRTHEAQMPGDAAAGAGAGAGLGAGAGGADAVGAASDMPGDKAAGVRERGAPLIEVSHVSKSFGDHQVIRDVSATFCAGEVAVIVGASGSGKSTFLRMLNRLERHDAGRILIDGIEVSDERQKLDALRQEVGMVVPAVQPVLAPVGAGQPHAGAAPRAQALARGGP